MVWWWVAGSWFALAVGVSLLVVRGIRLADRRAARAESQATSPSVTPLALVRTAPRVEDHARMTPRSSLVRHRQRARSGAGTVR